METSIDKLYIDIGSSSKEATEPIDELIKRLGRLDNMVNRMSFNSFVVQVKQLGRKAGGSAIIAIDDLQRAIDRIDTSKAIEHLTSMNTALRVSSAATFQANMKAVESSITRAATTAQDAVGNIQNAVSSLNKLEFSKGSDSLTKGLSALANFATKINPGNIRALDSSL